MPFTIRCVVGFTFACVLAFQPSCKPGHPPTSLALVEPPAELVSAHTAGLIGRKSPIEVRFVRDVVDADRVGQPAVAGAFNVTPNVPGALTWSARNALTFQPTDALTPGESYVAHTELPALLPGEAAAHAFDLQVSVVVQDFRDEILGLQAEGDAAHQMLSGRIRFTDEAGAADVERMLTAVHGEDELRFVWVHEPGNRDHDFEVHGIVRTEDASTLKLDFNGSAAGVDRSEERSVEVIGLNQFVVSGVRAPVASTTMA